VCGCVCVVGLCVCVCVYVCMYNFADFYPHILLTFVPPSHDLLCFFFTFIKIRFHLKFSRSVFRFNMHDVCIPAGLLKSKASPSLPILRLRRPKVTDPCFNLHIKSQFNLFHEWVCRFGEQHSCGRNWYCAVLLHKMRVPRSPRIVHISWFWNEQNVTQLIEASFSWKV